MKQHRKRFLMSQELIDIFGKALLDYQFGNYSEDIITWTNISDEDVLPLPYLFRSYPEMPKLEQKALQLAKGKILDVGCGAGSHSLYLQDKGLEVKAIDISKGAVKVSKARGVKDVELKNVLEVEERFDTILLLMNGTGIFQELKQVSKYLKHLKSILNPDGQILIDSCDIAYMYADEIEIEIEAEIETKHELELEQINHNKKLETLNALNDGNYYGELDYFMSYKGDKEIPMKWLYLDFKTLKLACDEVGLNCKMAYIGTSDDYLVKASPSPSEGGE